MSWKSAVLWCGLGLTCVSVAVGVGRSGTRATWRLRAPVLMYHHVQELKGEPSTAWLRYTVSPESFGAQLDWLKGQGYETVTGAALVRGLKGIGGGIAGGRLPGKPVVLTFDDGWACCFETVFPALRGRGMVGTFFVYPSGVGSPGYVTWAQLAEMRSAGMDIQAHSMTHPHLAALALGVAREEIERCRTVMGERLGEPATVFAYPFGEYSAGVIAAVRRAGYEGAFSTDMGVVQGENESFRLRRVMVSYPDDLGVFARVVGGG